VERATGGTFTLDRQLTVPNVGEVDGALGLFPADKDAPKAVAVIELKGSATDLDTDRFNGRTAVYQLFDYLNALPDTPWGIVSNFSTIRLYNKAQGNQTYELFTLQKLAADLDHFKAFWCLFEKGGMLRASPRHARAIRLLLLTIGEQRRNAFRIYGHHEVLRKRLIDHLQQDHNKSVEIAIAITDKILSRIIFVAMAGSYSLIAPNALDLAAYQIYAFPRIPNPRWDNFLGLFEALRTGHEGLGRFVGFQHELFAFDPEVDELQLEDTWPLAFAEFGGINYRDHLPPNFASAVFRSATDAMNAEMHLRTYP
jgi:hypothetical protein